MKQVIPCKAGFATNVPDTLHVFDSEFRVALPKGAQLAAFRGTTNITPRGLAAGQLMCEKDLSAPADTSYDIVIRVEQDRELTEAIAEDVKAQLVALGYAVRLWLCAAATQRYTYAYIRALENHHE